MIALRHTLMCFFFGYNYIRPYLLYISLVAGSIPRTLFVTLFFRKMIMHVKGARVHGVTWVGFEGGDLTPVNK